MPRNVLRLISLKERACFVCKRCRKCSYSSACMRLSARALHFHHMCARTSRGRWKWMSAHVIYSKREFPAHLLPFKIFLEAKAGTLCGRRYQSIFVNYESPWQCAFLLLLINQFNCSAYKNAQKRSWRDSLIRALRLTGMSHAWYSESEMIDAPQVGVTYYMR